MVIITIIIIITARKNIYFVTYDLVLVYLAMEINNNNIIIVIRYIVMITNRYLV